jgi:hypothetical protein
MEQIYARFGHGGTLDVGLLRARSLHKSDAERMARARRIQTEQARRGGGRAESAAAPV